MLVVLSNEEYDHARQQGLLFTSAPPRALEQGQADWGEASTTTKTRLVDPDC
jgi:hypothetical protein